MDKYIIDKVLKDLPDWVVEALTKSKCYISGGALTSVVTNRPINDYDIYFPNRESLLEVVAVIKEYDPHCSFISEKSITYTLSPEITLQLVHYDFYKTAKAIFKHFDYSINMAAIDLYKGKVIKHENFMLHNSQRYLVFNKGTKFPMISTLRIQKYKERGYTITRSQFMKVLMAVNKLKLKTWEDFSVAVGNLYGLNFIKQERMSGKFSLDKAFDIIENTNFDGDCVESYRWSPSTVDLVLSGSPIEYSLLPNGTLVTLHHNEEAGDLIDSGSIKSVEVPITKLIGDKLYKWVTSDLKSIYQSHFKYTLGEEAKGKESSGFMGSFKGIYCNSAKDLLYNCGSHHQGKVCLELSYLEEDVMEVSSNEIVLKKAVPVRVLTEEEFKTEILGDK